MAWNLLRAYLVLLIYLLLIFYFILLITSKEVVFLNPPKPPHRASMQTISAKNHGVNENVEKIATRKKSISRSARVSAALRAIAIADVNENGLKKI